MAYVDIQNYDSAAGILAKLNTGLGAADTAVQPGADVDVLAETSTAKILTDTERTLIGTAVQPGADVDVLAETSTAKILTDDERTKLTGIAVGATANSADTTLRDRANHTGTQAASTITGLATVATTGDYNDLLNQPALGDMSPIDTVVKTPAIVAGALELDLNSKAETYHVVSLDDDLVAGSISATNVPSTDYIRIHLEFRQATPVGTLYTVDETALSTLPGVSYLDSAWHVYQDATPTIIILVSTDAGLTWRAQTNAPLQVSGTGTDAQIIISEAATVGDAMTCVFTEYAEV